MLKISTAFKSIIPAKIKSALKGPIRSLLVGMLQKRYNIIHRAQLEAERKFFRADPLAMEKILNGSKINMFDIGARGGIDVELDKYRNLFKTTLVEPDPEEAALLEKKGYTVIKSLLGNHTGKTILNIGEHGGTSSVLKSPGAFLEFYTSGNTKRFNVIKQIELPMTKMQNILRNSGGRIDYLKLDTQGNELDILKGMGDYRPIIIKTEISFVPLYEDSTIFFHLGRYLYNLGYILFHTTYYARNSPAKHLSGNSYDETLIPTHGDAWFCPDWTRPTGLAIIQGRDNIYKALMTIFGMESIYHYSKEYNEQRNH